ncbi:radical SAM protein [Paludibacterium purpuratum]|uniref:Radical SAM superfamily enzyme YgiQ (UPF0313 family) n=1 Tax=Paludibacterium purpuratum TaxID=1144873 RepID=A0A4R7B612_9NEIS|nr:radical SAM protein [Paludibacterium purpuratum]TDR80058.1 radical SAM superfamily enzyme YgiQ (UPF0313 family) [Paludibacterium purpuratum]
MDTQGSARKPERATIVAGGGKQGRSVGVPLATTVKHQALSGIGSRPVRLLLVLPRFPEGFWTFDWVFKHVITGRAAVNPPLGLATLAALTPSDWQVTLVDENIESIDFDADVDLVAVGGMSVQSGRQIEILNAFRQRGRYVVAGGSYATLCPERYGPHADTLVLGEAEQVWPTFCQDFAAQRPLSVYVETGDVPLAGSPCPRHELIKWDRYLAGAIQYSRGCPFLCEFCDIIVMFSRKPRQKDLQQIEAELDAMRLRGVHNVVFVDDNLFGHPAACRALLAFLVEYQQRHRYPFVFGGEITINVASHPDVLTLLRLANFAWLFIGIETPNAQSLAETRKTQNLKGDMLTAIRAIYAHGIDVFGGFIVGFDADDLSIFDIQRDFIVDAGIVLAMVGMLMAPPRTPLYQRLAKEGRLVSDDVQSALINAGMSTNIIPLQMTRAELQHGTAALHRELLDDRNIHRRLANKLRYLESPPNYHFPPREWGSIFFGLLRHGIARGGPRRCGYFLASLALALAKPRQFSRRLRTIVANWSYALALRDYVDRTLAESHEEAGVTTAASLSSRPGSPTSPVPGPAPGRLADSETMAP